MRYIFHSTLSTTEACRAILYDEANRLIEDENEVIVFYCDGCFNLCFHNMTGNSKICFFCCLNYRFLDKLFISHKIKLVSLKTFLTNEIVANNQSLFFNYNNVETLKEINYENVKIGLAVLSSYVSYTRNLHPLINSSSKSYFDDLLRNCALMCDIMSKVFEEYNPDYVYGYNGRFIENRPTWEVAKNRGLPFALLEAQYTVSLCKKTIFRNESVHSISAKTNYINNSWDNCKLSESEKIRMGSEFFERRRNSLSAGDKIYTVNQELGMLPKEWDRNKKNIIIYNSSEDEYVAIGSEYEKYSLFTSQIDGIGKILDQYSNNQDMHFYLRIHPNLSNIKYSYHQNLYKYAKYNNLTIIEPESKISSYSLIDASDLVIVFGSTIGVEAAFWGKPTILLAGSTYYNLGCCYIPDSIEELFCLIDSRLIAKDKYGTYKYGLVHHDSVGSSCEYYDCNLTTYHLNIFGFKRDIKISNWQKIFGSRFLSYLFKKALSKILSIYCNVRRFGPKHVVPSLEVE